MFRKISALIAITLIVIPAGAGQQQTSPAPQTVLIRKNMVLKLSLMKSLDPVTAHVGDDVPLLLMRPLVVGSVTVLHLGEVMHGQITKVKRPGRNCRSGQVQWKVSRITFPDSTTARATIWFFSPHPDIYVPETFTEKDKGNLDNPAAWIMLSPVIIAAAIFSIGGKNMCSSDDIRNHPPSSSIVAVRISEDHRVRYY